MLAEPANRGDGGSLRPRFVDSRRGNCKSLQHSQKVTKTVDPSEVRRTPVVKGAFVKFSASGASHPYLTKS